ncbi:Rossmann-like and DUF2520 domain-containing protein [Hoylesella pleuritidis]|uniref:Rossmann-like and DUF2520 domain-containing protein n=1 Tax=Hoylesella pleuritidis TaxID=407975 RepID=UPI0028F01107|nr:Rossmann-like and DUF2520 domain-containing protein [Hoylesella pleuritidis]
MRIVLIGAGNLATQLGLALATAGHDIVQVFSRTMASAMELSSLVRASPIIDIHHIVADADLYIVAIKDSILTEMIPCLCQDRGEGVFVHTAGSIPIDVFQGAARHYGVLYPMQTFSKYKRVNFREIPCFVEGNDEFAVNRLNVVCASISDRVTYLVSADRRYLHLSAVFACNFVNHCYDIASEILLKHNLPFDTLLPLIDETACKVHMLAPREAQTGPAVRYDTNVIQAQAMLLKDNPQVKDLYERLSRNIHRNAINK